MKLYYFDPGFYTIWEIRLEEQRGSQILVTFLDKVYELEPDLPKYRSDSFITIEYGTRFPLYFEALKIHCSHNLGKLLAMKTFGLFCYDMIEIDLAKLESKEIIQTLINDYPEYYLERLSKSQHRVMEPVESLEQINIYLAEIL